MNIWFQCFFAVAFLLAGGRSVAEVGNQVVLAGARLIDGSGRPAVENSTLLIEEDKISAAGQGPIKYPAEAQVIDCRDKTIIPGLISDHSHIGVVDGTSVKPENYNRENILRQLRQYEAYGVTTVTALGLNAPSFYQLRADQHEGRSPGADVFGADCGIGTKIVAVWHRGKKVSGSIGSE
jgi:imidazolonepropionase-like amidohydrolase